MALESRLHSQTEWTSNQMGGVKRATTFVDGRILDESKYPSRGYAIFRETYPDGSKRQYVQVEEISDPNSKKFQEVAVGGRPPQVSYLTDNGASRLTVFTPKDQSICLAVTPDMEYVNWGLISYDSLANVVYDENGQLRELNLRTEKPDEEDFVRLTKIRKAFTLLANYVESQDLGSKPFEPYLDYYLVQIADTKDPQVVDLVHSRVLKTIQYLISNLYVESARLNAQISIGRSGLEQEAVGFYLSTMNETGDTFEECERKYPLKDVLIFSAEAIIGSIKDEQDTRYYRKIRITDVTADGYQFEENDVVEREMRPENTLIQSGQLGLGEEITSLDTNVSVSMQDEMIRVQWVSGGEVKATFIIPRTVDAERIKDLAQNPNSDFRKISMLLGAEFTSVPSSGKNPSPRD